MSTTQGTTVSATMTIDEVVAAYATASVGDKTRMRNAISDAAMAAIVAEDMESAGRYAAMSAAIKAYRPASDSPDYAVVASDLAATYEAAAMALRSGVEVDGVTVRATLPGTPDADRVAKLAVVPTRAKRSANGAVADFIGAHVTSTPRTIAELLRDAGVGEGYRPTSGAIGACLIRVADGTETPDGWKAVTIKRDGKTIRGAVAL